MRVKLGVPPLAWLALIAPFALACGPSSGFLRDANTAGEHPYRSDASARRYLRSVSGASSIGSVFCLIPTRNGAYRDAMAALHAQAKLRTNEVLENLRADHAVVPYLVYCEENLVLSADVYEIVPAPAPAVARRDDEEGEENSVCDPPYTIDRVGVEHFKAECLPSAEAEPAEGGPCDPPYTVDHLGIEHFRLECLPSDEHETTASAACDPPYTIDSQARKHFKPDCLSDKPEPAGGGACETPYTIDAAGRKHFKPECLPSDGSEPTDP